MDDRSRAGSRTRSTNTAFPAPTRLEESLPQVKGTTRRTNPGGVGEQHQGELETHSLPGTNQAGKGPTTPRDDTT